MSYNQTENGCQHNYQKIKACLIMDAMSLGRSELYINRELSLLEFNRRVLAQARDTTVPLLERLKFLCIFNANLDEFFEIRVAGLKQLAAISPEQTGNDGFLPTAVLKNITKITRQLVKEQYDILNNELLPALAKEKIYFLPQNKWEAAQTDWIKHYFRNEIMPLVSPVALDPAHPMPRLVNKSLNFIVSLEGKDAFGRDTSLAIVHAPRALPRLIRLPSEFFKKGHYYIFLSDIMAAYAHELFAGMQVQGCYQFRLTRNSDLLLDDKAADDLAWVVKNKLSMRPFGTAVRLEISANCPQDMVDFLLKKHSLTRDALYAVHGPVNLSRYIKLYDDIDNPELKYTPLTPSIPLKPKQLRDLFNTISKQDVLLHHPYQSFNLVIEFLKQAALDPSVLAIKQTLYRTGSESLMVQELIAAARAGKEVTAVIELRARFDEESNIELANLLQEAGVLVVYGVMDFKTHCKMMLIIRREDGELKRYCHLGTGNYHAGTARIYTDYGLLTADADIAQDVQNVFQQLTGMGKVLKLKKLWQAPFTLFKNLVEHIEQEATNARNGKKAHIMIKINGLTDPKIIQALYSASQAGVTINLIVRGICCLRPGIPEVSNNITVISIVGRFLEHERVYYFYNNGNEKIYCSSADWMERNFYKRVEVCFPIEDKALAKAVKRQSLLLALADNCQSWELQSDGSYRLNKPLAKHLRSLQQRLIDQTR